VFGVELTEAEFNEAANAFVASYRAADPQTQAMLATGWQGLVAQATRGTPAERQKQIADLHTVLSQRFAAGAQAGIPWAVAIDAALRKRTQAVATASGQMPEAARRSDWHTQMTEADLDADLETLYFMWVASGRDANLVTPQFAAAVRYAIVQNFAAFPQQVQLIFANGQRVYAALRGQWAQANAQQRIMLAQQFSADLDALGLTVPQAGGTIRAGGAWSDVNGKSHGEWAGQMVQGLAGSSYHSSW